ncbi:hypothetical protein SAY87_028506 [Trapa incisa]|uniref:Uncharacterized protein n=1 Tax=Trapa incisa TaxID=236973 RepID=A0AAN7KU50_9MYRT|nr:hypothetical protein SAY87_028506 [Trapa incisa]
MNLSSFRFLIPEDSFSELRKQPGHMKPTMKSNWRLPSPAYYAVDQSSICPMKISPQNKPKEFL